MRGVVMYSAGDVRVVNREDPKIIEPTDAIVKLSATCICGSDPRHRAVLCQLHLHGGPAPVRRFLPDLIQLILDRKIDPGKVFDLSLPLEQAADGYKAMDERRAIKVMLTL